VDAAAGRCADCGASAPGHQDTGPQGDFHHVADFGGPEGQRAPPRGEIPQKHQLGRKLLDTGRRQRGKQWQRGGCKMSNINGFVVDAFAPEILASLPIHRTMTLVYSEFADSLVSIILFGFVLCFVDMPTPVLSLLLMSSLLLRK